LTGRLVDFHFAATEQNKINLIKEGIREEKIYVVGNTIIDALKHTASKPYIFPEPLKSIINNDMKSILMTTHRRENLMQLKDIYDGVLELLELHEDTQIIFPVHKNPLVFQQAKFLLGNHPRVHLLDPLNYQDFANAMKHSHFIITDSGGIQEEAPSFGKPVLVARNTTERQEGVEAGTLKLVGTSKEKVFEEGNRLLTDSSYYQSFSNRINPYGDGFTSKRIVEILQNHL
jgi:UDP-N-acetylglucosamine 2-epimerase (non-hydrolysing)